MSDQQLKTLYDQYSTLVTTALQNSDQTLVNQITAKNLEISTLMDQMIRDSTMSGSTDPTIESARQELIQKLQRIQQDYNGLVQNTDKLETLRRIRSFNQESSQSELRIYLFVFLILAVAVFITLIFKRQNIDMATTMPSSPATMPPFI